MAGAKPEDTETHPGPNSALASLQVHASPPRREHFGGLRWQTDAASHRRTVRDWFRIVAHADGFQRAADARQLIAGANHGVSRNALELARVDQRRGRHPRSLPRAGRRSAQPLAGRRTGRLPFASLSAGTLSRGCRCMIVKMQLLKPRDAVDCKLPGALLIEQRGEGSRRRARVCGALRTPPR
jgi:hypothetical protein